MSTEMQQKILPVRIGEAKLESFHKLSEFFIQKKITSKKTSPAAVKLYFSKNSFTFTTALEYISVVMKYSRRREKNISTNIKQSDYFTLLQ